MRGTALVALSHQGPGPLLDVHILVNPLPYVTVVACLVAHLEFRCACVDIHITSEAESPVPAPHMSSGKPCHEHPAGTLMGRGADSLVLCYMCGQGGWG